MTPYDMSFADLESIFSSTTTGRISFKLPFAETYVEIQELIEEAIDWIGQELGKNAHLKCDLKEDQITIEIVHMLKSMSFDADHDTQYGGHCDIVVKAKKEFLWIAEAKVHSDYSWLDKGMKQLCTRYSTGYTGQDSGEVLIYVRAPRMDKVLEAWAEKVKGSIDGIAVGEINPDRFFFRTEHPHEKTGRPFRVRHKVISVHHDPVV